MPVIAPGRFARWSRVASGMVRFTRPANPAGSAPAGSAPGALSWDSPFPATLQGSDFRLCDVNQAFLDFSGYRRYWHTQQDTQDHCSPIALAKVGWVMLEWLKQAK